MGTRETKGIKKTPGSRLEEDLGLSPGANPEPAEIEHEENEASPEEKPEDLAYPRQSSAGLPNPLEDPRVLKKLRKWQKELEQESFPRKPPH